MSKSVTDPIMKSVNRLAVLTFSIALGLFTFSSTLAASFNPPQDPGSERGERGLGADMSGLRRVIGSSVDGPLAFNSTPEVVANLRSLRGRTAVTDKIRVIVGVRAAFAPEGFQDQAGRQRQRQEIGMVQTTVERALPRRYAARIKKLTAAPFMAMEVDAEQLEVLAAMPEVTDIQEDRQAWASLAQSVPLIQADEIGRAHV